MQLQGNINVVGKYKHTYTNKIDQEILNQGFGQQGLNQLTIDINIKKTYSVPISELFCYSHVSYLREDERFVVVFYNQLVNFIHQVEMELDLLICNILHRNETNIESYVLLVNINNA